MISAYSCPFVVSSVSPDLQATKILHGLSDFEHGIVTFFAFDGVVAAIIVLLKSADQFWEVDGSAAQRDLDAATLGQIANAIFCVDVQNMGCERIECGADRKSIDD